MKQQFLHPTPRPRKPVSKAAVGRALTLIGGTLILMFIYYLCTTFQATAQICVIVYMVIPAALLVTYFIYNRGFVYKDVTADMLPSTMSDEEKAVCIESVFDVNNSETATKSAFAFMLLIAAAQVSADVNAKTAKMFLFLIL